MKGKILFISKRADAASTRYRITQFIGPLQAIGWQCDYLPANDLSPLGRLTLARRCGDYSLVVIQRKLFDAVTLWLISHYNRHLIFDYDDAIFLNDDGSPSKHRARAFQRTTQRSRLALAGNSYLAQHSAAPRTQVLPTCIKLDRYREATPHHHTGQAPLKLVWIGSRSTQKYLQQHRDTLEAMGQHHPDLELTIISDFTMTFSHLKVRCLPWSEDTEVRELANSDIGIAPMTDDPWTQGKCGLKVIQYMACGLPVISSHCGANAEIIQQGVTGLLAATTEGWLDAIDQLRDPVRRQAMGEQGLKRVIEHYTVESQVATLDRLFTEMANQ